MREGWEKPHPQASHFLTAGEFLSVHSLHDQVSKGGSLNSLENALNISLVSFNRRHPPIKRCDDHSYFSYPLYTRPNDPSTDNRCISHTPGWCYDDRWIGARIGRS